MAFRDFEKNNDDAYTETVHIILEWFLQHHRPTVRHADIEIYEVILGSVVYANLLDK
jgi:hypothetical protein